MSVLDRVHQVLATLVLIGFFLFLFLQPAWSAKALPAHPVNINTGSSAALCALPGVGPATAKAIIAYRASKPFAKPSDIDNVKGIGPKKLAKMLKYITVGKEPAK